MSTYVDISVAAPQSPELNEALDAAFAEVERIEELMSEWRSDSDLNRVNEQAGIRPVKVSPELFELIRTALEISKETNGAFDISFASLGALWNFKTPRPEVPALASIQERLPLVNFRKIVLNEKDQSVMLTKKGMRLGLGAIAKGYTVDRASLVLTRRGFANHLVIAGGDLYASGTRGDRPWKIGIRDPRGKGVYATMEVENHGVATSGNYEKFFILQGVRYHHILDPKTGMPVRGLSSMTVIAKTATLADAYATGLFVLGKEKALELVRNKGGLEIFLMDEDFHATSSDGLRDVIKPVER